MLFRTGSRRGYPAARGAVVAAIFFSTWVASCARSQFDPTDDGPVGGSGGSPNAAGTSAAAGSPGKSGAAGASGSGGDRASAGSGGGLGKGGSAGSTMAPGGCKLVINEVCPGKADSDNPDDELIELYNTGGGVCDLNGFVLEYASDSGASVQLVWTGEAGDEVSSGSFFVVGGSKFGGAADATYTITKLGQNGGGVGLRGPSGDLVDAVAWDNAKASHPFAEGDPTASIPDGSSAARKSDGVDTDDNKNDFAIGPPSAGQAN